VPRARGHTAKYFTLAYQNPESGEYGVGKDDAYFMTFCVVLFTCLRAASMEHVFAPFAKAMGVVKRKDVTRFSEQAWLLVYYSYFWSLGLVSLPPDLDQSTGLEADIRGSIYTTTRRTG
jgi:acyl-CoA-dependent ceramide synthase